MSGMFHEITSRAYGGALNPTVYSEIMQEEKRVEHEVILNCAATTKTEGHEHKCSLEKNHTGEHECSACHNKFTTD